MVEVNQTGRPARIRRVLAAQKILLRMSKSKKKIIIQYCDRSLRNVHDYVVQDVKS